MKKTNINTLSSIIVESIIKEYYRGFEEKIKKLGFESIEDAAAALLELPEWQELFGPEVKKAADIVNDTTHLATMEYIFDKVSDEQGDKKIPTPKDNQGKIPPPPPPEALAAAVDDARGDINSTKIKKDLQNSDKEAEGVKLTKLSPGRYKTLIGALRRAGGINSDKVQKSIGDAIETLIKGSAMSPWVASKIADEDAPLLRKIGDEISKILDGDLSNLKERKGRKK